MVFVFRGYLSRVKLSRTFSYLRCTCWKISVSGCVPFSHVWRLHCYLIQCILPFSGTLPPRYGLRV